MTLTNRSRCGDFQSDWGKRLKWPDDYFTLSAELAYQRYILKDWQYFPVTDGKCNNISLNLTLARSSIDNPLFPRQGSEFSLSAQITPPYSLFDGRDTKDTIIPMVALLKTIETSYTIGLSTINGNSKQKLIQL